jgi:hypothetical protein
VQPGAEGIFDHVYARAPARLDAQRAQAERRAAEKRDAREPR